MPSALSTMIYMHLRALEH